MLTEDFVHCVNTDRFLAYFLLTVCVSGSCSVRKKRGNTGMAINNNCESCNNWFVFFITVELLSKVKQ
jgi:hypothetical protein